MPGLVREAGLFLWDDAIGIGEAEAAERRCRRGTGGGLQQKNLKNNPMHSRRGVGGQRVARAAKRLMR